MFRLEIKSVRRAEGASVLARAAYQSRTIVRDERQGMIHDYTAGVGVVVKRGVLLPEGAPERLKDRQVLWNTIDAIEKRKDAEVAKSITLTLPREGSDHDRLVLLGSFLIEEFSARGFVVDFAIHKEPASDGSMNEHAHILFSERPIDASSETGFAAKKDLSRRGPQYVYGLREAWERKYNEYLLKKSAEEAPVVAKSEWKRVRDRAREVEEAPLPEKLAAVASLREFETRPAKVEISGGEYQAALRRPESGYERRQRKVRERRDLIKSRRLAISSFTQGVRRAFPVAGRRVHHLAVAAISYFDKLLGLKRGDRLPRSPFDEKGGWRPNDPARIFSPPVPESFWVRRNADRAQTRELEFAKEQERVRERPPPVAPPAQAAAPPVRRPAPVLER